MNKIITSFISYLIVPLLIAVHWYTQSTIIPYLFGLLAAISSITLLAGAFGLIVVMWNNNYSKAVPPLSATKIVLATVYQASAFAYLVYIEAFVASTLYVVVMVAFYLFRQAYKEYTERQAELVARRRKMGYTDPSATGEQHV
jgi:beta-lactamase regulating signal transducer with metallopeptidase domain